MQNRGGIVLTTGINIWKNMKINCHEFMAAGTKKVSKVIIMPTGPSLSKH